MLLRFFLDSKRSKGALRRNKYAIQQRLKNNAPLGDEQNSLEFKLSLDGEVLDSEMVFPVVGQALVEGAVFLWRDVGGVASPDGLGLVELLDLDGLLLDHRRVLTRYRHGPLHPTQSRQGEYNLIFLQYRYRYNQS